MAMKHLVVFVLALTLGDGHVAPEEHKHEHKHEHEHRKDEVTDCSYGCDQGICFKYIPINGGEDGKCSTDNEKNELCYQVADTICKVDTDCTYSDDCPAQDEVTGCRYGCFKGICWSEIGGDDGICSTKPDQNYFCYQADKTCGKDSKCSYSNACTSCRWDKTVSNCKESTGCSYGCYIKDGEARGKCYRQIGIGEDNIDDCSVSNNWRNTVTECTTNSNCKDDKGSSTEECLLLGCIDDVCLKQNGRLSDYDCSTGGYACAQKPCTNDEQCSLDDPCSTV